MLKMCKSANVSLIICSFLYIVNCIENYSGVKLTKISHSHILVRPEVYHSRTKRELYSTRCEDGEHYNELLVKLNMVDEEYILDLSLNHGFLPDNHTISYYEGGKAVQHRPKKEEIDFCHYSGRVRGEPRSWVALSTCRGLRGGIFDGHRIRYLEPVEGTDIRTLHYVYENDDLAGNHTCGNEEQPLKANEDELMGRNYSLKSRHKRDLSLQGLFDANEKSRFVELALVVDFGMYEDSGRNLWDLHQQLQQYTNVMNAIYAPLNIFVALTAVEVWTEGDRILIDRNITSTLYSFKEYRRKTLFRNIGAHDHAQLLSKTVFETNTLGLSFISSMCSYRLSCAVVRQTTMVKTGYTMAHEMGHSFGMHHDNLLNTQCWCPDGYCVMYSSTVHMGFSWSECSLKVLKDGLKRGSDYCLRNKPTTSVVYSSCGNGYVDPDEQCDCGSTLVGGGNKECQKCCDPSTCRLRPNAKCATGACCNLQTCQIKPARNLCRRATSMCDLSEYCTGDSEFCPEDVFVMDTTPCTDQGVKAYCMQGQCRTHDSQCRMIWGATGEDGYSMCYEDNTKGNYDTNCGYGLLEDKYTACSPQDTLCGRLHCNKRISSPVFGDMQHTDIGSITIDGIKCYVVRIDFGLGDVDPGLVPDGAACGSEKMCYNQRCLPVKYVQSLKYQSEVCLDKCHGHGICDSKAGHCQCENGYEPPLCLPSKSAGEKDYFNSTRPSNTKPSDSKPIAPTTVRPSASWPRKPTHIRPSASKPKKPYDTRPSTRWHKEPITARPYASWPIAPTTARPYASWPIAPTTARPYASWPIAPTTTRPSASWPREPTHIRPSVSKPRKPYDTRPSTRWPKEPTTARPYASWPIAPTTARPYASWPTAPTTTRPSASWPREPIHIRPSVSKPRKPYDTRPSTRWPKEPTTARPYASWPKEPTTARPFIRWPILTNTRGHFGQVSVTTVPSNQPSDNRPNMTNVTWSADNNRDQRLIMFIIFFGIVPFILLMIVLICLVKRKSMNSQKNNKANRTNITTQAKSIRVSIIGKITNILKLCKPLDDCNKNERPENVMDETNKDDGQIMSDNKTEVTRKSSYNSSIRSIKLDRHEMLEPARGIPQLYSNKINGNADEDPQIPMRNISDLYARVSKKCKVISKLYANTESKRLLTEDEINTTHSSKARPEMSQSQIERNYKHTEMNRKQIETDRKALPLCGAKPLPNPKPTTLKLAYTKVTKKVNEIELNDTIQLKLNESGSVKEPTDLRQNSYINNRILERNYTTPYKKQEEGVPLNIKYGKKATEENTNNDLTKKTHVNIKPLPNPKPTSLKAIIGSGNQNVSKNNDIKDTSKSKILLDKIKPTVAPKPSAARKRVDV